MSRFPTPVTPELADYLRRTTSRDPEVLRRVRESTDDHPHASMQIAPDQGQFLQLLTRLVAARQALEIGVFMGYSSRWIAMALPPSDKLIACDISQDYAALARRSWREAGVDDRIDLRLGPALQSLDALLGDGQAGAFDLAFIDADKGNYSNYYERALQLLRPGGLIVADYVLWDGAVADPNDHAPDTEAIRAFNCKLQADPRVAFALATVGDGLALACKL